MAASYNGIPVPSNGAGIRYSGGRYQVPDNPIIPFIEGDGTGRDIWKASVRVFDAAVEKAYKGKRRVAWYEIFAGEKAKAKFDNWLPDDSVSAVREYPRGHQGPVDHARRRRHPFAERGAAADSRSLCLHSPGEVLQGTPSPVKHPERMDIVIFRENTEDVYAGIEWEQGTAEVAKLIKFLNEDMLKGGPKQIRLDSGVGIKPISITGTKRLVRMAIQHALESGRKNRDPGAQGQYPEVHRRRFPQVGIRSGHSRIPRPSRHRARELDHRQQRQESQLSPSSKTQNLIEPGMEFAPPEFRQAVDKEVTAVLDAIYATHGKGAWKKKLMINDRIADSIFQQVVTRADEYSVLATPNLNGDYISDACAAQVGGLGIAPGANVGDGYAIFEATHGTAPKYADKDVINPGSVMLSGVMMFRFPGLGRGRRPDRARSRAHHRAEESDLRL